MQNLFIAPTRLHDPTQEHYLYNITCTGDQAKGELDLKLERADVLTMAANVLVYRALICIHAINLAKEKLKRAQHLWRVIRNVSHWAVLLSDGTKEQINHYNHYHRKVYPILQTLATSADVFLCCFILLADALCSDVPSCC